MNRWKRISLLIIFTLIFGVIAFFHESRLGRWVDNEVYDFIYSTESLITTSFFIGVTRIAEVWVMICLSLIFVAYLLLKRYNIEALLFALTMTLSSTLNPLLKNIFERERPTLLRLIDISGFSFQSGHAMGSTAFFGSLIYIANRLMKGKAKGTVIALCACLILSICISRVYLGVHYTTDVVAGFLGGAFCLLMTTLILRNQLQI